MRLFLDTNVLIDFISERKDTKHGKNFYEDAATIIAYASLKKVEIVVSSLTVINAMYICIERMKLSKSDVREKMDFIRSFLLIASISSSDIYSSYDS